MPGRTFKSIGQTPFSFGYIKLKIILNNSYLVAELTWPEVKTCLEQDYLAVLPIGAGSKEHGLHLPMNTDYLQAEWLAKQTVNYCHSLIWPIVSYGYYPAFINYPGSCSVSEVSFSQTIADILQNILMAGANRILIINTGISTIRPLENTLANFNQAGQIILFNAYTGPHFTNVVNEIEKQTFGSHADEIETSIMLALFPDKVEMTKAKHSNGEWIAGPLNPDDAGKPNYSPHGVIGDARLATIEKGQKLTRAIMEDLAEVITAN